MTGDTLILLARSFSTGETAPTNTTATAQYYPPDHHTICWTYKILSLVLYNEYSRYLLFLRLSETKFLYTLYIKWLTIPDQDDVWEK
jgi:hypothetical protein